MKRENPSRREGGPTRRGKSKRRKKQEQEKRQALAQGEREKLQKLHFMKCPKCGMDLVEIDYKSIKVDKCSGCEGVWLDPGELEAVGKMEKSMLRRIFGG